MLDWERLDPHGVSNLPHNLSTKYTSSTFEVRGRVDYSMCVYGINVLAKFQTISSQLSN